MAGRQAGGSGTCHRKALGFSKDASAGRLSSQDPKDLIDTVLSYARKAFFLGGGGPLASGRGQGTAAEKRVTWKCLVTGNQHRAGQNGPPGDRKPDIGESRKKLKGRRPIQGSNSGQTSGTVIFF